MVDSAPNMHMVIKKDLNSAALETARASKSPTTVMTANGEVLTKEEATVYVRELDLFVTERLLEDTPCNSDTRNTLRRSRVQLPLDQCSDTTSHQKWQKDQLQHSYAPFVVHGLLLELFSSRISVDQDLSVIVAEIDNDDDVKQRLVSIVFHASVTQQRSSGSKTRISCSHVHERTNSCPPLQTRVREKGSHTN